VIFIVKKNVKISSLNYKMFTLILINKNKGHKMKKLTLAILLLLASFSIVSAEIGFKIGASAQVGNFETSGSETENSEVSDKAKESAFVGMASYFVEQNLGFLPGPLGRINLGYAVVPHDLKSGKSSRFVQDLTVKANVLVTVPSTNVISATLQNIETLYVSVNITDWLYVKAGTIEMDVKTTESLDTGSAYGNTSLSGDVLGLGLHHQTDSGFFGRIEYLTTDIGGTTLTSTTNAANTVTLDNLEGETVQISFGKAF
jgi:hypothetical protein